MAADVWVTDHALRRFLERVRGVPLRGRCDHDALRWAARRGVDLRAERLVICSIVAPAIAVGAARLKLRGLSYIFDGPRVVTITPYQRRDFERQVGGR